MYHRVHSAVAITFRKYPMTIHISYVNVYFMSAFYSNLIIYCQITKSFINDDTIQYNILI